MKSRYPTRIGRYEVIDRLGIGGMGAVYLASDPLLGRTVAVKILHTDDDELRQRFEREARSAASLRHQHIVTIYDIGDDEGGPFLAMEFLDGESMAEIIRRRSPLPIDARLEFIAQLCSGLGYAHRNGIIHRDIKPANLMITSERVLKIVDFGLARVTSNTSMTRAGMLMGTPHYMSPEQVQGTGVDHLSDIFSVGMVLYELIAYRKAYQGDSTPAILHNIVHGEPAPISSSVGELDTELETVVAKAIERPKNRRYQDLRELGADLERIRLRLKATSEGATILADRSASEFGTPRSATPGAEDSSAARPMKPPSSHAGRTPPGPRRNLDVIARKRAAQIAQHLAAASEHVDAGRLDLAVEQCEHVLLLDPHDGRALQLLEQAHEAIDERQVSRLVDEARAEVLQGALTRAEELVEQALQLRSQSTDARGLQQQIREMRRERERAADRARAVKAAVERARRNLQEGALEAAARAASEALGYDPAHEEAITLRDRASAALEERRQEQALDKAAHDAAVHARERSDAGNHSEALAALRRFVPPHPIVNEAIAEIDARVRAIEQERRAEEERAQQRAFEEARRQEQLTTLRQVAQMAVERGDWTGSHAAVRAARESLPGDQDLERLCRAIETETNAAEAVARLRSSAQRHLRAAEAAAARGDLLAAVKSVDAAIRLTPEDVDVLRLQQVVNEQLARAEAARQQMLREQQERERVERERVEGERREQERLLQERQDKDRLEQERLEQARLARERQEQERLEQERQQEERRRREQQENERLERERAAEKRREAEVQAALARDRRLAAEARARAEALRLSAEEERSSRELRDAQARVQQSDLPRTDIETPPVQDQPPIHDDAPAAMSRAERATEIQPDLRVPPDVLVRRAEPRRSRRVVASVIAAAAVVLAGAFVWWREPASEIRQPPPSLPRVDHSAALRQALDQYQRGEVAAATNGALSIPESAVERQQALELLQGIRRDAAARAQAERRAAETAGKTGEAAFLQAVTKEQEAERAASPAETERVVSLLAEATALYRQAATTGWSPTELLRAARRESQANRIPRAIEYAVQALTVAPGDGDVLAFLRSIRAQAERQAQAAAEGARRAGAAAGNSPAYREAVAHENTGRRATDVKETQRAYEAFSKARDQYAEAVAQVRDATQRDLQLFRAAVERVEQRLKANDLVGADAALQEVQRLNASDPALERLRKRIGDLRAAAEGSARREAQIVQILDDAERESNDYSALKALQTALTQFPAESRIEAALNARRRGRDDKVADLIRRARGSSGAEAVQLLEQALALDPSRNDVRADRDSRRGALNGARSEREVRETIEKFKTAYESRDVAEVLRVAPNMSSTELERQFKPFRDIRLSIAPYSVALAADETSASVTCVIRATRQIAGISARPVVDSLTWQFQLTNVNGTWRITAAQFR